MGAPDYNAKTITVLQPGCIETIGVSLGQYARVCNYLQIPHRAEQIYPAQWLLDRLIAEPRRVPLVAEDLPAAFFFQFQPVIDCLPMLDITLMVNESWLLWYKVWLRSKKRTVSLNLLVPNLKEQDV